MSKKMKKSAVKTATLNIGFFMSIISLILAGYGYYMYTKTYAVFSWPESRMVMALTGMAAWCLIVMIVVSLIAKDKQPYWLSFALPVATFCLVLATLTFVEPCISPITINYTVNMGDVETNAVGAPMAIQTTVYYLLSCIFALFACFAGTIRKKNKKNLKAAKSAANKEVK